MCITLPNLVQLGQAVVEIWLFSIFQDGGRLPSWICKSSKIQILNICQDWRANVHHPAKFSADRSSRCGDMAVFRFFKMAAVCHLRFVIRLFGPPMNSIWWSLSRLNLVGIGTLVSIICKF